MYITSLILVFLYTVRKVLANISVSGTTLSIQSRDCIASPENYRIVATFTNTRTELVNVPFNTTIEHDMGNKVFPNTEYNITVVLMETTSDTVIDERTESVTTPLDPPLKPTIYDTVIDERMQSSLVPFKPHTEIMFDTIDSNNAQKIVSERVIIIRESVDSLCRDDADMPMPPYIRKACNHPNAAFVSLFRYLPVIYGYFST